MKVKVTLNDIANGYDEFVKKHPNRFNKMDYVSVKVDQGISEVLAHRFEQVGDAYVLTNGAGHKIVDRTYDIWKQGDNLHTWANRYPGAFVTLTVIYDTGAFGSQTEVLYCECDR